MKRKLLLLLVLILGAKWTFAQDSGQNDVKNVRFGLTMNPMLTWFKPEDTKKFQKNGTSAKIGGGLDMEFRLNNVASISTGFLVNFMGGKLSMLDTNYYFLSKDGEFQAKGDSTAGSIRYKLNSRIYNSLYVTLPLTMKLKTPQIGSLTYYGQFGINTNLRWKSKVTDDVTAALTNAHSTQTDLDNSGDMQIITFGLNLGVGAEWSLAGTTSMVFGLNYISGFSSAVKGDSAYLFRTPSNNGEATKQNAKSNAFALTVGFVF